MLSHGARDPTLNGLRGECVLWRSRAYREQMLREPTSINDNFQKFASCAASVARYLRRRVRDADQADELFQEVSILVLRHPHVPATEQSFDSWCRGIARNAVAHHFRKQRRQASLLNRVEPEGHRLLAQAPEDPERTFATRELLERTLATFDERSRRLLVERYFLGRSAEEIGEQVEQSPTAVRMRLMRARSALQKRRPRGNSSINTDASD
jgi:RNA polymerase sigma factor (sigma-70 family)